MADYQGKPAVFFPHLHDKSSVERIMWDVVIALVPAGLAGVWFFGMNTVRIAAASLAAGIVTELLMNLISRKPVTVLDGSAVITSLLFAYMMPPSCPLYIAAAGCAFSIAIVKWSFGGLGHNFMNPAVGGYIFAAAAWNTAVTGSWSPTIRSLLGQGFDFTLASQNIIDPGIVSGVNPLQAFKAGGWVSVASNNFDNYLNLFLGDIPGTIGETSKLALLIGLAYLMARRVVLPAIPLVFLGSAALFAWIFGGLGFGAGFFTGNPLYHILSGGMILSAGFIATDYVTSPLTIKGKIIYAFSLGVLTMIIRIWGSLTEGAFYAVALMNIVVPLIDRVSRDRIYGYKGFGVKKI